MALAARLAAFIVFITFDNEVARIDVRWPVFEFLGLWSVLCEPQIEMNLVSR